MLCEGRRGVKRCEGPYMTSLLDWRVDSNKYEWWIHAWMFNMISSLHRKNDDEPELIIQWTSCSVTSAQHVEAPRSNTPDSNEGLHQPSADPDDDPFNWISCDGAMRHQEQSWRTAGLSGHVANFWHMPYWAVATPHRGKHTAACCSVSWFVSVLHSATE